MKNLDSKKRILAQCTIDPLPSGKWLAVVSGLERHDGVKRVYTISAPSDTEAARQALARFEEDVGQ